MTESFWHPEDKTWIAARKEQWRHVKQTLDVISTNYTPFKRKFHKYHKELFFYGTVNPECRSPNLMDRPEEDFYATGHDPFEYVLPLFRVWYHPEPDKIDFNDLLTPFVGPGSMDSLRDKFFDKYFAAGASHTRQMFSAVEGMMNGREALMIKLVCPGFDYLKLAVQTGDPQVDTLTSRSVQSECAVPSLVERWVINHTWLELMRDARFVPYAPGQYLWDHFSYTMEHYPDKVFRTNSLSYEDMKWRFMELISEILEFEQRTDASRNRPSTIAMVESLVDKYERKDFSDAMLKLWEETMQNFGALQKKRRFIITYFEPKQLKCRGVTIEQLEERVKQWKQV